MEDSMTTLSLLIMMMDDRLKSIAKLHTDILESRFQKSKLVLKIVDYYRSSNPITEGDLNQLFNEEGVNGSAREKLITEYKNIKESTEAGVELIKSKFKDYIAKLVLDRASQITEPGKALNSIINYKYNFNASSDIAKKIKKYNLSTLKPTDVIKEFGDPIKSSVSAINDCFTIKGYQKHQLVCVVAPPSCGKSLFLMNETVKMLNDGNKVCYIALGDLNECDFMVRCSAIGLGVPMDEVQLNLEKYWAGFKSKMGTKMDNFGVFYIDADELSSKDVISYIKENDLINQYNVFIVDYDTNFKSSSDSMYSKGEEIYNDLSNLSKIVDLVFIASQPKTPAFGNELIAMNDAAESGRKPQIVDVMITISKNQKSVGTQIGMINLAKVRRNGKSTHFPYMLNPSGAFIPIAQQHYKALEADTTQKYAPNKGVIEEVGNVDSLITDLESQISKQV